MLSARHTYLIEFNEHFSLKIHWHNECITITDSAGDQPLSSTLRRLKGELEILAKQRQWWRESAPTEGNP
jgi:hypothetical protein